jgi:hypothetical protein
VRQSCASDTRRRRPDTIRGDHETPAPFKTSLHIALAGMMWLIVYTTVYIL